MVVQTPVLILVGPSGVGKTTLCKMLTKEYSDLFSFSISHTSRYIRDGEKHGVHYYFISNEEFDRMKANDEFLEYTSYVGSQYGTSKYEMNRICALGMIPLLDIDVKGFKQLYDKNIPIKGVFVNVPSMAILKERLFRRGNENLELINKRLERAEQEIEASKGLKFDYYLINENLDASYENLKQKILEWYPGQFKL